MLLDGNKYSSNRGCQPAYAVVEIVSNVGSTRKRNIFSLLCGNRSWTTISVQSTVSHVAVESTRNEKAMWSHVWAISPLHYWLNYAQKWFWGVFACATNKQVWCHPYLIWQMEQGCNYSVKNQSKQNRSNGWWAAVNWTAGAVRILGEIYDHWLHWSSSNISCDYGGAPPPPPSIILSRKSEAFGWLYLTSAWNAVCEVCCGWGKDDLFALRNVEVELRFLCEADTMKECSLYVRSAPVIPHCREWGLEWGWITLFCEVWSRGGYFHAHGIVCNVIIYYLLYTEHSIFSPIFVSM